jgi:hypothetical protein
VYWFVCVLAILTNYYNLVFLGPEIALSAAFRKVLQDDNFQSQLVLVAIDELHVVEDWGADWRTSYSSLSDLRGLIRRDVPWFGTSATLDPATLEKIKISAGFASDVKVLRTLIDRPDIALHIRPIAHPINSFRDLEFVVEATYKRPIQTADILKGGFADAFEKESNQTANWIRNAIKRGDESAARQLVQGGDVRAIIRDVIDSREKQPKEPDARKLVVQEPDQHSCRRRCRQIPKTIVYMDSINHIERARQLMIHWLVRGGCSKTEAANAVKTYHSELAEFDKQAISSEFIKPDCDELLKCSRHRVILATDAMGMGINNPDIRRVVQYRLPPNMRALMQRAGRTARGPGITGEFVWLVESWCFGPTAEQVKQQNQASQTTPGEMSRLSQTENTLDSQGSSCSELEYSASARPGQGSKATKEAERRSKLPPGFWKLINGKGCIRKSILIFFGENLDNYRAPEGFCCSRCAGSTPRPRVVYTQKTIQSGAKITQAVQKALLEWRTKAAPSEFNGSLYTDPSILMPDSVIRLISRSASTVLDLSSLAELTKSQWAFFELFGLEVFEVVKLAKKC